MKIPTEPIGSIPRSSSLKDPVGQTLKEFEATGSPVVTDGEQTKPSFATYPIAGLDILVPGGVTIPFADGHTRQLPKLAKGPFRYATYASQYLIEAKKRTQLPVKQAVISASALSLLYPHEGIAGYPRATFIEDLLNEAEKEIRLCLEARADSVQIDFTEARLSLKLDPTGGLLEIFIELNNKVLSRFSPEELKRIGVHTCSGGDADSTHSADIDYAGLLPKFFQLKAGRFYVSLCGEKDRRKALALIKKHSTKDQMIFIGVTDAIDPKVETPEQVRDRVLEAAEYIPLERLGTCDDCGFSPFADDTSTSRETAFAKVRARVEGTRLAEKALSGGKLAKV